MNGGEFMMFLFSSHFVNHTFPILVHSLNLLFHKRKKQKLSVSKYRDQLATEKLVIDFWEKIAI